MKRSRTRISLILALALTTSMSVAIFVSDITSEPRKYDRLLQFLVANSDEDDPELVVSVQGSAGIEITSALTAGDNPIVELNIRKVFENKFFWVSVLVADDDMVFQLLPTLYQQSSRIQEPLWSTSNSSDGASEVLSVRLILPLEELENDPTRLVFEVEEPTTVAFGATEDLASTSLLFVLFSDEPVFSELRPTQESLDAYLSALETANVLEAVDATGEPDLTGSV